MTVRSLLVAILASAPGVGTLVVPLRPDGAVVRLNLRPYEAAGVDARAFEELDSSSEKAGWPARHHRRGCSEARPPAYQVLTGGGADHLVRGGAGTR